MKEFFAGLMNGAVVSLPVTLAVWMVLRLISRRGLNAATRYAIWWGALAIVLALPLFYLPTPSFLTVKTLPAASLPGPIQPLPFATTSIPQPQVAGAPMSPARLRFPVKIVAQHWIERAAALWVAVSAFLLLRLAAGYLSIKRRERRASLPQPQLAVRLKAWINHCGTHRNFRVSASREITMPMASGPTRPCILIPTCLLDQLKEDELDQIGLHEAAHLARRDDWALVLQRVLEALFPLHPSVRFIARQIDLEREIACDDFVVQTTGCPRPYAACLTRIAGLVSDPASLAASGASHLTRRIEMLLNPTRHNASGLLKMRLAAVAAGLAAVAWTAVHTPALIAFATPPYRQAVAVPQPATLAVAAREPNRKLIRLAQARPASPQPTPPAVVLAPVLVPVTVTIGATGKLITGLKQENFQIFEDGVEQTITRFDNPVAVSLGIVLDATSDGALGAFRQIVDTIARTAGPNDDIFLLSVNSTPQVIADLPRGVQLIENPPTSLQDAVYAAGDRLKSTLNRSRAIFVFTDEDGTTGSRSQAEVRQAVYDAEAQVHVVRPDAPSSKGGTPALLGSMAAETGGTYVTSAGPGQPLQGINWTLIQRRNEYLLEFVSSNSAQDGKYRNLMVKLTAPGLPPLRLQARPGYIANRQ